MLPSVWQMLRMLILVQGAHGIILTLSSNFYIILTICRLLAQTTLRNILGTKDLYEILSNRESISGSMQVKHKKPKVGKFQLLDILIGSAG